MIAQKARGFLNRLVDLSWHVYEYRASDLTLYFMKHCQDVISVVCCEFYAQHLRDLHLGNEPLTIRTSSNIDSFPDSYFDCVVARNEQDIHNAMPKIRDGGIVILNDASLDIDGFDRIEYVERNREIITTIYRKRKYVVD